MIEYYNNIAIIKGATHRTEWVKNQNKLDVDGAAHKIANEYIKSGMTVLDIGANIGTHSIVYSNKITSNGKLYAIDPCPEHCVCLNHNLPDWVTVVQTAISDKVGVIGYKKYTNTGCNRCVENKECMTVNTTTIDAYFSDTPIHFIKMDIEGYETKALMGALNTIKKYKPILCIESNRSALREAGSSQEELYRCIGSMGYDFECLNKNQSLYDSQPDIICISKQE